MGSSGLEPSIHDCGVGIVAKVCDQSGTYRIVQDILGEVADIFGSPSTRS